MTIIYRRTKTTGRPSRRVVYCLTAHQRKDRSRYLKLENSSSLLEYPTPHGDRMLYEYPQAIPETIKQWVLTIAKEQRK